LTFAAFLISLQSRGSPGKAKRPDMNNGNIKKITYVSAVSVLKAKAPIRHSKNIQYEATVNEHQHLFTCFVLARLLKTL
jgi:hypothetical protein